ncbi:MAG: dicarboxylate/amino acid:cation symporter [Chloroflexia bacterium]|nr:dicarboxylate/amino acid:cation symporter [Chloroflexia bacterium]
MKLELHWQILIGLILGIIFGVVFPTTLKITDETISKLEKKKAPIQLIQILQSEKEDFEETETEFLKRLKPSLGPEIYKQYQAEIVEAAKYNAYLPYVSWMGELFMRALRMIIVPLILTSIISGVANIGTADNLGRLGLKTMLYYMITSTLAILIGLFFVSIIKPGVGVDIGLKSTIESFNTESVSFSDTLMQIVPTNIFESFVDGHMLSIIFFSILFGFFITRVADKFRIFLTNFFNSSFEVMMKLTNFIIRFTPLGILGIVAVVVAESPDLAKLATSMGKYMITVLIALAFHSSITLPLILKLGYKANPWAHFKAMRSALMTAFSTSSSGATLSITMSSVNENCGVSNKISSFTLPLGATINMDGTALYELVAVFFIAQAYGIELSFIETIIVIATALLASIGAAGIPMAGLIMMTIILTAVGLPLEGVSLIISVDRLLDMFRTSVNVWSDSCGAVVIAKSEGETLKV